MNSPVGHVRALIAAEQIDGRDPATAEGFLRCLCAAAVRAVPASGAALNVLVGDGSFGLWIDGGAGSKVITELQVTLGEGPSVDAHATRRPVFEPSLGDSGVTRWPVFAAGAMDLGVRAVFAFPLQVGAARLGVLELHRTAPGSLTDDQLRVALTFAQVGVSRLLGSTEDLDGSGTDGFEAANADQAVLHQAQGMAMVQLGVSLGEASLRLRAHAYATGRRLTEVARDLVERRIINLDGEGAQSPDEDLDEDLA